MLVDFSAVNICFSPCPFGETGHSVIAASVCTSVPVHHVLCTSIHSYCYLVHFSILPLTPDINALIPPSSLTLSCPATSYMHEPETYPQTPAEIAPKNIYSLSWSDHVSLFSFHGQLETLDFCLSSQAAIWPHMHLWSTMSLRDEANSSGDNW